jgi:hypothetical protein
MSLEKCSGLTIQGKKCNRTVSNKMYCYQHINQSISYSMNSIQPINIELIKQKFISNNTCDTECKKRNEYGEYICKQPRHTESILCHEHYTEMKKVCNTVNHLSNIIKKNANSMHIVSYHKNFMMYCNLVNFIVVNKKKFIYYIGDKPILAFLNSSINNISGIQNGLNLSNRITPVKLRKQNRDYTYYKMKYEQIIIKLNLCIPSIQIEKNRNSFISNSIKLQKISNVYININNKILPVFCKGVNEKILLYIV